jgi:hypothetical protein
MKYLPWIFGVAALWLMAAPFLLGYAETTRAMQNDLAVGAVMFIAACLWWYSQFTEHDWTAWIWKRRHGRTT